MARRSFVSIRLALSSLALAGAACWASSGVAATPEAISFAQRPAQVGDTTHQSVRFGMRVNATQRRDHEVLQRTTREVGREQARRVTVTEVRDGRAIAAEVRFDDSQVSLDEQRVDEPVAGKAYRCRREGDQLRVTTPDGAVPPIDEYEIVSRAMQSLGKPNPLATVLAGKTLQVGDRVDVPVELAADTLGLSSQVGRVERFTLKLDAIESIQENASSDAPRARFSAEVTAGAGQMRMIVTGPVVVDPTSCRVTRTDLVGPMAMSELRGVGPEAYRVDTAGKLRMRLASRYEDVR